MKAFLKRTWRYFIFIPIIAVVVIGIFLNLPKTEKTLALTASDLKVAVGEKVEVSYEVNIPEADCDFSIEDKNVALVDRGKVLGVSEGQTLLTIKASFRNSLVVQQVVVEVYTNEDKVDTNNPNNDNTEDGGQTEEDKEENYEEKPIDKEESADKDDSSNEGTNGSLNDSEGTQNENNQYNDLDNDSSNEETNIPSEGGLNNNIIVKYFFEEVDSLNINLNSFIVVEIVSDSDIEFICPDGIKISEVTTVVNSYKIEGLIEGEYSLLIKSENGTKVLKINVL